MESEGDNIARFRLHKSVVLSVRVAQSVKEKLDAESELESISINTLISQILTKHVEWDRFAEDAGFVLTNKPFLRAVIANIDEKTLATISATTCKSAFRDAVIYIYGRFNLDTFLSTVDQILSASNISFRHLKKNGNDRYMIQHDLGSGWTLYFSTVITTMLNEIGYRLENKLLHEHSISFDVAKV